MWITASQLPTWEHRLTIKILEVYFLFFCFFGLDNRVHHNAIIVATVLVHKLLLITCDDQLINSVPDLLSINPGKK